MIRSYICVYLLQVLLHSGTVRGECLRIYCNVSNCEGITCYSCLDGYFLSFGGCSQCYLRCSKCNEFLDCTECLLGYWGYLCESSCSTCTNGCDIDTGTCLEGSAAQSTGGILSISTLSTDTAQPDKKSDEPTNGQTKPTAGGGKNEESPTGKSDQGNEQSDASSSGNVLGLAIGLSAAVVVLAVIITAFGLYYRRRILRMQHQNPRPAATPGAPVANTVASNIATQYISAPQPTDGQYLTPTVNSFNQSPYTTAHTTEHSAITFQGNSQAYQQSLSAQNFYPDSSGNVPSAPPLLESSVDGGNFLGGCDPGTIDSGYVEMN